jgi:hypothetical protein
MKDRERNALGRDIPVGLASAGQSRIKICGKRAYRDNLAADQLQPQSISVHHHLDSGRCLVFIAHLSAALGSTDRQLAKPC